VFLVAGTARDNSTALTDGVPRAVQITKVAEHTNGGDPALAASVAPGPGATTPPT